MATPSAELPVRPEPTFHPEATADARTLDWIVNPRPTAGVLDSSCGDPLPTNLNRLLRQGRITRVSINGERVTTVLGEGQNWSEVGPVLRDALYIDLAAGFWSEPGVQGTQVRSISGMVRYQESLPGVTPEDDAQIALAVEKLLSGSVGRMAASHGGPSLSLACTRALLRWILRGACRGCPASASTLGRRIEVHVRRAHPGIREVRQG